MILKGWSAQILQSANQLFNQVWHFKRTLLCLNTISFEKITLDQQIYFQENITINLWISSPCCMLKQWLWEADQLVFVQVAFWRSKLYFDIRDYIYLHWIYLIDVIWLINEWILPFYYTKKKKCISLAKNEMEVIWKYFSVYPISNSEPIQWINLNPIL